MFSMLRRMLGLRAAGTEKQQDPTEVCDDCAAADGQLHDLFCTRERCPFCGNQLITCDCIYEVLHLTPEEKKARQEYIDDDVEPLRGVMERWKSALRERGRIPFRARKLEATADDLIMMAARGELEAVRKLLALGVAVDAMNEVHYTALMAAARNAQVELVGHLLKRGADPRHRDIHGHTALHCAVGAAPYGNGALCQVECVELLLKAGAELEAETNDGGTALSSAAWFGCAPAVEVLLKAGADPKRRDQKGRTPADLARARGHDELARRLS